MFVRSSLKIPEFGHNYGILMVLFLPSLNSVTPKSGGPCHQPLPASERAILKRPIMYFPGNQPTRCITTIHSKQKVGQSWSYGY